MVKCNECGDYLWFSPEGYLTCKCDGLPFKEVSPHDILGKILEELKSNLQSSGFLEQLTRTVNNTLKVGMPQFSENEIEKVVIKTIENAVAAENPALLKQTLTLFLDEIILYHDGRLEMYLIAAG
jgi:hypothetical protein